MDLFARILANIKAHMRYSSTKKGYTFNPLNDRQINPVIAGYYANLELPYGTDLNQVTQSWKRLLKKYHPDLYHTDPDRRRIAEEIAQQLNLAYNELVKFLNTGG